MHQRHIELSFPNWTSCWITINVPNNMDDEEFIDNWIYTYFPEDVAWEFDED